MNYLDNYIPTPLGYNKLRYMREGQELLTPDPPNLQAGYINFAGQIRETKYYLLKLERELDPISTCCDYSYSDYPYKLEVQVSEYQYLRLLNGSYIKPGQSLYEKLWVPKQTEYKIVTLFDVPPYWYAALLGAGCAGNEDPPLISFPNLEYRGVMEAYNTESYYVGLNTNSGGYTPLISYKQFSGRSELWRDLNNLEYTDTTWWNAFIPTPYKFGVWEDRLLFIKGLMDYKGWVDPLTGRAKILITSKLLHDDLHWLVRSVGGWTNTEVVGCSKPASNWLMEILLPDYIHPFGVARDNYIPHIVQVPPWKIVSVEDIEPGEYKTVTMQSQNGYSLFGEVIVKHLGD